MNIFVRFSLQFLFIVSFLSCGNKDKKPAVKDDVLNKNDTTSYISPEKIPNPYDPVDISPMDMSYFPVDYPKLNMAGSINTPPVIRLIYSRPHLQGRILFQDLLKYGQPWRMGANEATEIHFYREVTIRDKHIPAGRYVLYCIPEEKNWTIILNTNTDTWGLKIDSGKDFQKFEIPVTRNNPRLEYLTMVFEKTPRGADLVLAWSDILGRLSIDFAP
jgi:hypothetical protein